MSERPKILVVDDEPAVAQALSRAFALERYDVEVARDGGEALEALAAERFDAVLLDVTMPGVSGLEVCRRLRASGDRSPVLMLTARDAIDDRVAGLDAGADDYLVKPFALRELMARVRALLRRRGRHGRGWRPTDRRPRVASAPSRNSRYPADRESSPPSLRSNDRRNVSN